MSGMSFSMSVKTTPCARSTADGLHITIANTLQATPALNPGALPLHIGTATLDQPEHGLSEARLA